PRAGRWQRRRQPFSAAERGVRSHPDTPERQVTIPTPQSLISGRQVRAELRAPVTSTRPERAKLRLLSRDGPVPARYTGQNDRRDAHSVRRRARRPARRRAAPAGGLRRVAQAGGPEAGTRSTGADAAGDGTRT